MAALSGLDENEIAYERHRADFERTGDIVHLQRMQRHVRPE
jgi:hypothetical protein